MNASLYYEYGMMLCINTPAPKLRDVCDQCWQNAEGRRSDDIEVTASADEKRREHVGSERRGWRRGDGTGRLTDREGTKKLKNSINTSRRIVIWKRGWGGRKHRGASSLWQ
jgi:hypothetical protein